MGITVRHYLFPAEGAPLRISARVMDGLIFDTDAIPHLAGTEQRLLSALVANEDGTATHLAKVEGFIWQFDDDGKIRESLLESLKGAMESIATGWLEDQDEKVVDLNPRLSRKRRDEKYRWEPSPVDIGMVIADIWPEKGKPRLKELKGVAPKPPAVSYEAKNALSEAASGFLRIIYTIEKLSEHSLKGFAYRARQIAVEPDDGPLYVALAQMAERRLEILRRRKSEKGTWIASLEVVREDPEGFSETVMQFYQRCEGRTAAIAAARRLLVEHSGRFEVDRTVEASVVPDIEWRELANAQEVT